jgi:hypothetical protein
LLWETDEKSAEFRQGFYLMARPLRLGCPVNNKQGPLVEVRVSFLINLDTTAYRRRLASALLPLAGAVAVAVIASQTHSKLSAQTQTANPTLRPKLEVTVAASDATPPSVSTTSPASGATVSGTTRDTSGNTATSAGVSVNIRNGSDRISWRGAHDALGIMRVAYLEAHICNYGDASIAEHDARIERVSCV